MKLVVSCESWLCASRAFDHLGLGRAAVHDKGPGQAGADIGHGQAHQVRVLVETLVVAGGIGA